MLDLPGGKKYACACCLIILFSIVPDKLFRRCHIKRHNMFQRIAVLIVLPVSMAVFSGSCGELICSDNRDLLADGLAGWQEISEKPGRWKYEDGILYTEGDGTGWFSTIQEYSDFRLELEFRVPPGGNSGVFLRSPHEGDPAYMGMEIQILDDYAAGYVNLKPSQYTGSIYDVLPPAERLSKKANQWQKMVIRCIGRKVTITLNEKIIVEANLDNYSDKLQEHQGLSREKGYIGLQNHGSRVEFRNINIHKYK